MDERDALKMALHNRIIKQAVMLKEICHRDFSGYIREPGVLYQKGVGTSCCGAGRLLWAGTKSKTWLAKALAGMSYTPSRSHVSSFRFSLESRCGSIWAC